VLGVEFSQAAAGSQFQLAATAAAWAGLQQCWSAELYVAPLADRFLRLALQIVARYGGWLAAALTHRSSTAAAAAAGVSDAYPICDTCACEEVTVTEGRSELYVCIDTWCCLSVLPRGVALF